jgi:hypothetical protein
MNPTHRKVRDEWGTRFRALQELKEQVGGSKLYGEASCEATGDDCEVAT